jgi:hypothetical protein
MRILRGCLLKLLAAFFLLVALGYAFSKPPSFIVAGVIAALAVWIGIASKNKRTGSPAKYQGTSEAARALAAMHAHQEWRPASEAQMHYADDLEIPYDPNISMADMSVLLTEAIERRKEESRIEYEDREYESMVAKLADLRAGKPESRATQAQKELANRLKIIYAVDSTKREIGDAIEAKLIEKRKAMGR